MLGEKLLYPKAGLGLPARGQDRHLLTVLLMPAYGLVYASFRPDITPCTKAVMALYQSIFNLPLNKRSCHWFGYHHQTACIFV